MRKASAVLKAFLDDPLSRDAVIVNLFNWKLSDGSILRYSGWTTALTVPFSKMPGEGLNTTTTLWETNTDVLPNTPGATVVQGGTIYYPGDKIQSPSGVFELVFQLDGNVVLRQDEVIWSTDTAFRSKDGATQVIAPKTWNPGDSTSSPDGEVSLVYQTDGNVVLYQNPGVVLWETNTDGITSTTLEFQADGNLVLYNGVSVVWESNTDGNPGAILQVQNDGNLVIYLDGGTSLWDTATAGTTPTSLVFQTDGNLVLYDDAVVLFESGTSGHPGSYMQLQNDGNLVIYDAYQFNLGPSFGKIQTTVGLGIQPSELDLEIYPSPDKDSIGSLTWQYAARVGFFQGAIFELDRLFCDPTFAGTNDPGVNSYGSVVWFYGIVADIDIGRSVITMKIKSLPVLMEQAQFPNRLYGGPCNLKFGGHACGYNRVTGVAADGTTGGPAQITVTATTTSQARITNASAISSDYVEGTVTGASGQNAGISRVVANNGNGFEINVFKAFPYAVNIGDTFTVLPGCPHTVDGCNVRNNIKRYGGFVHIPPPEAAI